MLKNSKIYVQFKRRIKILIKDTVKLNMQIKIIRRTIKEQKQILYFQNKREFKNGKTILLLAKCQGQMVLLTQKGRFYGCDAHLEECTRGRYEDETAGTNLIVQSALLLGSTVLFGECSLLHEACSLACTSPAPLSCVPLLLSRGLHGSSHSRI